MSKLLASAVLLVAASSATLQAQTTGFQQTLAGPYDYNDPANWVGGNINGIWNPDLTLAAAQTVVFGANSTLPANGTTGLALSFGYAGNFALTLRADNATPLVSAGTGGTIGPHTITLNGDILNNTASALTVTLGSTTAAQALNIDLGGGSRTLTAAASHTLSLLNTISNGALVLGNSSAAAGSVVGTGTVILSGTNTFAGGTTLNAGTLNLGNNAALGLGALTINGGSLNVTAARTTTNNNLVNVNGDFTFAGTSTLNLGTGNITLGGGTRTITASASTLTLGGAIGDGGNAFGLIKAGAGALVLNGVSTYTGGTTVNAGSLTVGATGNLGGNTSGNNVAVNGAILSLGAATNLGANQTLSLASNATSLAVLGLGFDGAAPVFTQVGAVPVVVGINTTTFNTALNEATLGSGNNFLGSTGTGTYGAATLGAGLDGTYRLGGGGGTLTLTNGVLTGTGSLLVGNTETNGGGTVVLQGANTLSGATTVVTGTLRLGGAAGALSNSALRVDGSTLAFDSSTAGLTGATRAGNVTLVNGSSLTATGNTTANSVDAMSGVLTTSGVGGGYDIVTVAPGTGRNERLSIGSLARDTGGVFLFRGTALGTNSLASATANSTNIQLASAPTLVGGGGAAGSTNISIIPYAAGGTSTSATPTTFVTYDAANGIRPLNTATEFAAAVGNATDNVRLTASVALTGTNTVNSLLVVPTLATTISGGTLAVTSGAILLNTANTAVNTVISSGLDFGGAQGVIGVSSNRSTTLSGGIAGSAGLTLYSVSGTGSGVNLLGGTANTFTGDSFILANISTFSGGGTFFPNGTGTRTGDVYVYAPWQIDGSQTINGLNGNGTITYSHTGGGTFTIGGNNAGGNYSGVLSSTTGSNTFALIKNGTGTQTLTGTSFYSYGTTVNGGTLAVGVLSNGGAASSIGASSSTASNLALNGGSTLSYIGSGSSTDRLFTSGPRGVTLDSSGTGAVNFTNTGSDLFGEAASRTGTRTAGSNVVTGLATLNDLAVGARAVFTTGIPTGTTITAIDTVNNTVTLSAAATTSGTGSLSFATDRFLNLTGSNTGNNTLSNTLNDGSLGGTVGIAKTGTGTWAVSGNNSNTGPTTVGTAGAGAANITNARANGGMLSATGPGAFGTTASITVHNGGTFLVGASDSINDFAPITLGTAGGTGVGGTLAVGSGVSEGTGATKMNGVVSDFSSAGLNSLTLASSSTLDFGAVTTGTLVLSTFIPNTFLLNIINYTNLTANVATGTSGAAVGDDRLIFNSDQSGNLSHFSFGGVAATQIALDDGYFEVVAVPEPTSVVFAVAGIALLASYTWRTRRQARVTHPAA